MKQCGPWHKMEKKLFDIHNVASDLFDETIETKMMHSERGEPSPQGGRCLVVRA